MTLSPHLLFVKNTKQIMDDFPEELLYQAVVEEDFDAVTRLLLQGANPNKASRKGKTPLGEAATNGNIRILKVLIDTSKAISNQSKNTYCSFKKPSKKFNKRKVRLEEDYGENENKLRNSNLRHHDNRPTTSQHIPQNTEPNQGYFVFIHNDTTSSDQDPPLSPLSISSQSDYEWDEEIGNAAPSTSEDETWSSMYEWYASILETTGPVLVSAALFTCGVDQQDYIAKTALHYASENGHIEAVKLLVDAGCKIDLAAREGYTPLHFAVLRNEIEIAEILLDAGAHINYKNYIKKTPLHFATSNGRMDMVKLLVERGAYIEARDTRDITPLFHACGRGYHKIVKYLLSKGAEVNCEDCDGHTPVCHAVWNNSASAVQLLLEHGARIIPKENLIHCAVINRQESVVRILADHDGGINTHGDNGDTPFLLACRLMVPNVIIALIEKGANINLLNDITGISALHLAIEHMGDEKGLDYILMHLIYNDIALDLIAITGDTALNRALLLDKDNAAKLLICYGADVNICDMLACGLDNLAIVSKRKTPILASLLIKAGHKIPVPDTTALVPEPNTTEHWIYYACRNPLSLQDYCRLKIRLCKGEIPLFLFVDYLPLPTEIRRFLLMLDEM